MSNLIYLPGGFQKRQKEEKAEARLNPEELSYFKRTEYLGNLLLSKIKNNPEHQLSKQLLTMAFHYYALGLYSKSQELLKFVRVEYFQQEIFDDLDRSVLARNKVDQALRKQELNMAYKYQIEARFFLVIIELIPYLRNQPFLKNSSPFAVFLKRLGQKPFIIQLAPYLGAVPEKQ